MPTPKRPAATDPAITMANPRHWPVPDPMAAQGTLPSPGVAPMPFSLFRVALRPAGPPDRGA
jgi:hypothetical protein